MKVSAFIADTPGAALAKIHEQFGPEAVVLGVRRLPAQGLARLWQKHGMVEVLAGVLPSPSDGSTGLTQVHERSPFGSEPFLNVGLPSPAVPLQDGTTRPHVFIGPPGVGKTSLLCKWLVFSLLSENCSAQVWRLDGVNPNTSDSLNVYGEMFGFNVHRFWLGADPASTPVDSHHPDNGGDSHLRKELRLIDLPGVEATEKASMSELKHQLSALGSPRVHLILNAAYEASILAEQALAFESFKPEDLSFTHLDEERRPEKLLKVASGINCSLRFLGAGQKVPGEFFISDSAQRLSLEAA